MKNKKKFSGVDREWIDSLIHLFENIFELDFVTLTYDIDYFNSLDSAHTNIIDDVKNVGSCMKSYRMIYLNEKILSGSPRSETIRTLLHEFGHIKHGNDESRVLKFERRYMP